MKTLLKILITISILFTNYFSFSQVEPFTKYYNLDPEWVGNYFEQIIHTPDGGYAAVFNQNQGFTMRTSLLKLDQYGEVEWQTIIEDEAYLNINGFSLCIDNFGNYYIAGSVQVIFNDEFAQYDALLSKFDNDGNILWTKNYNLNPDNTGTSETIHKIVATENNKVIAVGCQSYCEETPYENSLVLCFDSNGEIDWMWYDCDDNVFQEGFVLRTNLVSVIGTPEGAFYAVGSTNVAKWFNGSLWKHSYLGLIVKFNEDGEIIYNKSIGLPDFQTNFTDICMISDNDFAVTGWISDTSLVNLSLEDQQALFIFDSTFNLKYQNNKFIGGGSSKQRITMTKDSILHVVAATDILKIDSESDYKNDLLILKYSTKGELLWYKYIGGHDIDIFTGPLCVIDNPDNSVTYGYNQHDYTSKSGFS
ncbi:MAG: hypothetical protein C0596_09545 [Marinilabiliales bacterium]|nr:MAG: hypothetical protein C0596_09545 [Marinilabiliales bacterium]